jgi:hypothetical protein
MKLKIAESELVNVIRTIIESDDDIRVYMKRRHGGLLQSIQKQVSLKKDVKEKIFEKKIEKKTNYLIYLWLLLIPLAIWLGRKWLLK